MPRGDGTGPQGKGPGTGRGMGPCGGGRGGGGGGGRQRDDAGTSQECICPKCGIITPHRPGKPCSSEKCPKCGSSMVRNQ
ncbi:MAG TPA: DUF5320 family protein [Patescibacteria group bacterium]|nr:DUF5320 family protein [Patescibacteria group bacterium]